MPDPNLDPSDAELEMVADEVRKKTGLGPARRSPEQGIADMQTRLELLTAQKSKLLDQLEDHPTDVQLANELSAVNKELLEAKERLAEYQSQFEGRN